MANGLKQDISIGENLKRLRKQAGLTQGQAVGAMTVAAICGMIGSYLFGVIDTKFGTKIGVTTDDGNITLCSETVSVAELLDVKLDTPGKSFAQEVLE